MSRDSTWRGYQHHRLFPDIHSFFFASGSLVFSWLQGRVQRRLHLSASFSAEHCQTRSGPWGMGRCEILTPRQVSSKGEVSPFFFCLSPFCQLQCGPYCSSSYIGPRDNLGNGSHMWWSKRLGRAWVPDTSALDI